MSLLSPPFRPSFGTGAPGVTVPKNQPYFDTSTTPYTPYVWNGSAWKSYGVSGGSGDATLIQGVPIDPTAPLDGQTLIYDNASGLYKPGSVSASTPSIVQVGFTNDVSGAVTMPAGPTQGNLLIAICENNSGSTVSNTGWTQVFATSGSADGFGYGWKIAGASEPTTQTPSTQTGTAGGIAVWEIAGAANPGMYYTSSGLSGGANQNITTFIAKQLVVGMIVGRTPASPPSAMSGVDHFTTHVGSARNLTTYDVVENSIGSHAISATMASQIWRIGSVIVGP